MKPHYIALLIGILVGISMGLLILAGTNNNCIALAAFLFSSNLFYWLVAIANNTTKV